MRAAQSEPAHANGARRGTPRPFRVIGKRSAPRAIIYREDCREIIPRIPDCAAGAVDLIFADPPFNWNRAYDRWNDAMPDDEYCLASDAFREPGQSSAFTGQWLDACVRALAPTGSLWVNIPDDWAAEIVVFLKRRGMTMVNWCVWHYRFGQNTNSRFINSKVHALYFAKDPARRTWNPGEILEVSDRRSIYFDKRTESKRDGVPSGMRVPMDVWYGKFWGRIQGNNTERRHGHDNQLPEVYLERVILACSNPGDLVLDPFLGSGTTGTVAHAWGRRFIGVEYSPDMASSACERIAKGMVRKGASQGQSTAIFGARRTGGHKRPEISSAPDSDC